MSWTRAQIIRSSGAALLVAVLLVDLGICGAHERVEAGAQLLKGAGELFAGQAQLLGAAAATSGRGSTPEKR